MIRCGWDTTTDTINDQLSERVARKMTTMTMNEWIANWSTCWHSSMLLRRDVCVIVSMLAHANRRRSNGHHRNAIRPHRIHVFPKKSRFWGKWLVKRTVAQIAKDENCQKLMKSNRRQCNNNSYTFVIATNPKWQGKKARRARNNKK